LRAFIAERLSQFVESPQVDVSVLRFASQTVVVSGAVIKAGQQPITTTPLSVVEAVGAAGVDPLNADLSGLTLTRDGREYKLDLDTLNRRDSELQGVYLKGGDRLYLPYNDQKRIYVMGEVNQPRALSFKSKSINLTDALGTVGGLNQTTSNGNAVYRYSRCRTTWKPNRPRYSSLMQNRLPLWCWPPVSTCNRKTSSMSARPA